VICRSFPFQAETSAKKEDRPKSPSLLARLLGPFKNEKSKAEKKVKETEKKVKENSPRRTRRRRRFVGFHPFAGSDRLIVLCIFRRPLPPPRNRPLLPRTPAPAEVKPEETPAPEPVVEAVSTPVEPVKETETPAVAEPEVAVPETTPEETKKEEKEEKPSRSPVRISRRLSARVGEFFKSKPKEVNTPREGRRGPPKD
jgi:hypothetical protein